MVEVVSMFVSGGDWDVGIVEGSWVDGGLDWGEEHL